MSDLADIIAGGIQDTQSIKPEFGMGYVEGSIVPFFNVYTAESFSVYPSKIIQNQRELGSSFILGHQNLGWLGYLAASVAAGSQPFLGDSKEAWVNVYNPNYSTPIYLSGDSLPFAPTNQTSFDMKWTTSCIAMPFTPSKSITLSGISICGLKVGTGGTRYICGIRNWLGGSPTDWICSGLDLRGAGTAGWYSTYFQGSPVLDSGTKYCISWVGSSVSTAAYIRMYSLSPIQNVTNTIDYNGVKDIYDYIYDSSVDFYVGSNVWASLSYHPIFKIFQTNQNTYFQAYTNAAGINVAANSYVGERLYPSDTIYLSGVGLPIYRINTPKDDCWMELRNGDSPFASLGSWKLVGSETVTTTPTWYSIYNVNTELEEGKKYFIDLKSILTDSGSPYRIYKFITATADGTLSFGGSNACLVTTTDSGNLWTIENNEEIPFKLYGGSLLDYGGSMVFTNDGKRIVRDLLGGNVATYIPYIAMGSSNVQPTVLDTSLGSEFTDTRIAINSFTSGDYYAELEMIVPSTTPTTQPATFRELGVFSNSNGSLVMHTTFPDFTKTRDIELQNLVTLKIV